MNHINLKCDRMQYHFQHIQRACVRQRIIIHMPHPLQLVKWGVLTELFLDELILIEKSKKVL